MADEDRDSTTQLPAGASPGAPGTRYMPHSYEGIVRSTLMHFGSQDPDGDLRKTGEYWKHCQSAGISPQTCGALIYETVKHKHIGEVALREKSGAAEASPGAEASTHRGEEWEVRIPRARGVGLEKVITAAGRRPDEVTSDTIIYGDFYDDEKATAFSRKLTNAGFINFYGPRPRRQAAEGGAADRSAYHWVDVGFQYLEDAERFASLLEKRGREIATFVGGTKHGATVNTNASWVTIDKVLAKHRWKGAYSMPRSRGQAAEQSSADDWLITLVSSKADPTLGLAFVPDVVRAMMRPPYDSTLPRAHSFLRTYAEEGELELRPEGGLGRLSAADKKLCLPGPQGTVLSWVRVTTSGVAEGDPSAMPTVIAVAAVTPPGASEPMEVVCEPGATPAVPAGSSGIPWVKVTRDVERYTECVRVADRIGPIKTPLKVYELLGPTLNKEDQEVFLVVLLNLRGELRGVCEVARGQRSRVTVGPADVLRPVITSGAEGYLVVHNHPSGKSAPSKADRELTDLIAEATKPYGKDVCFIDHCVVSLGQVYSICENKLYRV